MGWGYPGSTPGVNPKSQGVIPRRFKRKKIFVTNGVGGGWTHRREGGNSGLDYKNSAKNILFLSKQNKIAIAHCVISNMS